MKIIWICGTKERVLTSHKFLLDNKKYNKLLNYSRKDENLQKKITNQLYKNKIYLSVSRLETLKRCPFSYYSKYILELKQKKEYKLSKMDMGSIMHEVIEKISRHIITKGINWQDVAINQKIQLSIKQTIDGIVDDIFNKKFLKYNESIRTNVLKINLKKGILNVLIHISNSINQSEFIPLGFEIGFDNNSLFAPIELNLDDGRKVFLRGKIDRVDIATVENKSYLRVIDYKSSIKNLKLDDIKQGLSLQLMTYMSALINNKEKLTKDEQVFPAALNYFTINTSVINLTEYEKNEQILKEQIIRALKFKGIYIKDVDILKKLDTNVKDTKSSYIDANITKFKNEQKYIMQEDFIKECENIKIILKKISKEITKGLVKIEPFEPNNCRYCEYKDVCRTKSIT